jgi:N-methylhydantoinase A
VRVPMLDIHTVGAGGGSIARVDSGGSLRVGPESAGAVPGPACYGAGTLPTVTDAHVLLGRIAADQLAGGAIHLDAAAAEKAIAPVAEQLGLSIAEAAAAIVRVANSNMERAIRAVSLERGEDPRDFPLVAFGGCGGLHACEIARELGIATVIVPREAGALSALGMLLADRTRDYSLAAGSNIGEGFRKLTAQAKADVPKAKLERFADMRYAGQSYELTVPWSRTAAVAFHAAHHKAYGYSNPERAVEIVTLRLRAVVATRKPDLRGKAATAAGSAERRLWLSGRWRKVPVLQRDGIGRKAVKGPALIADYGATTLVPEGWTIRRDAAGSLVLTASAAKAK